MGSTRDDPIALQAAEWLLELQRRDITEERLAAWHTWLDEDTRHKQAFDRLQVVQECIDAAQSLPWPTDEDVASDVSGLAIAPRPARQGLLRIALAAAAALAALAIGVAAYHGLGWHHDLVVATSVGELRRVQLADGSTVTLGGRSRIAVDMRSGAREVALSRGEAFFEVAKDATRPFTVRAGDAAITAVGTAFDVRRGGERVITAAVPEGAVNVKRDQQSVVSLTAGQQARLAPRQALPAILPAPETAAGWREGRRQYLAEPLADVIADLGRYSTRRIVIDDDSAGQLAITGAVFERDIVKWLRSLQTALPVDVRTDSDGTVHVRSRRSPSERR